MCSRPTGPFARASSCWRWSVGLNSMFPQNDDVVLLLPDAADAPGPAGKPAVACHDHDRRRTRPQCARRCRARSDDVGPSSRSNEHPVAGGVRLS